MTWVRLAAAGSRVCFGLFRRWVTKRGPRAGHYAATGPGCLHAYCINKAARGYRTSRPASVAWSKQCARSRCAPGFEKRLCKHRWACDYCTYWPISFRPASWMRQKKKVNTTLHLLVIKHHHKIWFSPEKMAIETFGFSRLSISVSSKYDVAIPHPWICSLTAGLHLGLNQCDIHSFNVGSAAY